MSFELDHIFICADINAPEADRLISFGLTEGRSRIHQGQGTTNRCFFFHNAMLELLWVHSPAEAQSETTRPIYLWERWRDRNQSSCPFGFCLRPNRSTDALPFSTWAYRPTYLPDSRSIFVGQNVSKLTEPMLFYLPFAKRQDAYPVGQRQPLDHTIGFTEITRVTFVTPHGNPSPELRSIVHTNLLELRHGEAYRLELGFDNEQQGKQTDFRSELPLMLFW